MAFYLDRRTLLASAGALAGLSALPFASRPGYGAQGQVSVLGIIPQTGPYAADGERIKRGQEMALEDFRASGSGLDVNLVLRDSAGDAGTATRRVSEAIERENVVAIAGPWADDVAAAVTEVAKREKRVHFWSGGPLPCHRYYFQWAPPYYTGVNATMRYIAQQQPDAKRWYMLTSDYAFGWTLEELEKRIAPELGIEFVGSARHVLGEREFSPYMSEIAAANPDVIVLNNFGLDTAQALRAAHSFGLTQQAKILVPWGSGIEDYLRLDPSITQGVVIGSAYYYTIDNPTAESFAKRYIERFDEPPGYPAGSGYAVMRLILEGLARAENTEPASLVRALEGWEGDTVVGKTRIDRDTHQTYRPFFVTEGKAPDQVQGKFDLARIVSTVDADAPADVIGCENIGDL
ncbi:ABC transporter substrate-binding protein [Rhodoligotrophos defluvii]|uniref:ABC transporter substrate-binding protein n=1 Tax=Rhodoligotrophos defluvii TaxID=2561934 RepID=UPI0010C9B15F|nr:ABC transporter substrate-binding protein [Rhodoligotrophos defluvii]